MDVDLKEIVRKLSKKMLFKNKYKNLTRRVLSKIPKKNRRVYRFIDFKRKFLSNSFMMTLRTCYDPMRTSLIKLVCFPEGFYTYILMPSKLDNGIKIINLSENPKTTGDSGMLKNFKSGSIIHNLTDNVKEGAKYIRSAGCFAILLKNFYDSFGLVKLKSGELRYFDSKTIATLGSVSNESKFLRNYKKAGALRHIGVRPRVRPSAMNPVDHPMGGRTRGGFQPTNKKGQQVTHKSTKKYINPLIFLTKRQKKFKKRW